MPVDVKIIEVAKKMQKARTALMQTSPFFSILLSYMKYSVDENCGTAYTDGGKIAFDPKFSGELSDEEMQFVLCHEVMHVALRHCSRTGSRYKDRFVWNLATDIVVNSNIAATFGLDFITLKNYGVSMHLTPDGEEGCLYSAEEVYDMLIEKIITIKKRMQSQSKQNGDNCNGIGGAGKGQGKKKCGSGKGCGDKDSGKDKDENGDGYFSSDFEDSVSSGKGKGFDNHDHWQNDETDGDTSDDEEWLQRVIQASKIVEGLTKMNGNGNGNGLPPSFERIIKDFEKPQTDWRTLLNNFIQEEICDYSFNPPDKRLSGDFILPDFNDKSDTVKNVLFMIDTSGSINDKMLVQAFSEIKGAIDQFDGRLEGFLGFFDHAVSPAIAFDSVENLLEIKPIGGGGTSFKAVFKYVNEEFVKEHDEPATIVILTDGYAEYPKESETKGIPVLWLINNKSVTPPFGVVARVEV